MKDFWKVVFIVVKKMHLEATRDSDDVGVEGAKGTDFAHATRPLRCAVHDGDFTFAGLEQDMVWVTGEIRDGVKAC